MTAEKLMKSIGYISDRYIEQFAVIKPTHSIKNMWLKLVSVAACIAVVFGVANIALKYVSDDGADLPRHITGIIGDEVYTLLENKKTIKQKGLPQEITEDMIGDLYGKCELSGEFGVLDVEAYDYLGYEGTSILIVEFESKYCYLFFSNQIDIDTVIPMSEWLSKYGLQDNITEIVAVKKNFISSKRNLSKEVKSITNELLKVEALTGGEFDNEIFRGKTNEEQQSIRDKMNKTMIEIVISGNSSDTLIIYYFSSIGYARCGLSYYKMTPKLNEIFK